MNLGAPGPSSGTWESTNPRDHGTCLSYPRASPVRPRRVAVAESHARRSMPASASRGFFFRGNPRIPVKQPPAAITGQQLALAQLIPHLRAHAHPASGALLILGARQAGAAARRNTVEAREQLRLNLLPQPIAFRLQRRHLSANSCCHRNALACLSSAAANSSTWPRAAARAASCTSVRSGWQTLRCPDDQSRSERSSLRARSPQPARVLSPNRAARDTVRLSADVLQLHAPAGCAANLPAPAHPMPGGLPLRRSKSGFGLCNL